MVPSLPSEDAQATLKIKQKGALSKTKKTKVNKKKTHNNPIDKQ